MNCVCFKQKNSNNLLEFFLLKKILTSELNPSVRLAIKIEIYEAPSSANAKSAFSSELKFTDFTYEGFEPKF